MSETPIWYDAKIQPIDFMRGCMNQEQVTGFLRGNVIKYLFRYDKKGGVDDLRKAKWYLDELIKILVTESIIEK
jgi:hypothetical protein